MSLVKQLLALVLALAVLNPLCCCLGSCADIPAAEKSCCAMAIGSSDDGSSPGDSPALPCRCSSRTKVLTSGGEAPVAPALAGAEVPSPQPYAAAGSLDIPTLNSALWAVRVRAPGNAPPPVQRDLDALFCVFLI